MPGNRLVVLFLAYTGIRWGEMAALVDLAGAAADVIGRRSAQRMDADERWALAKEVATAARRCAQFANRFAPYNDVPALLRVLRLTHVIRQLAALDPPGVAARASLDAPIASRAVPLKTVTGLEAVDAAAGLLRALEQARRDGTLTMRGALAISASAESTTAHTARLASELGGRTSRSLAWSHASDSWRVVQAALVRFDDGSRFASPTMPSLTDIAGQIETAVARWAQTGRLFARARSLPLSEERVPELIHDHAVVVRPRDIGAVLISMRVAHRLSCALAVELDRSAGHIGEQPQPRLIRALATAARLPGVERDARWANELAMRVAVRSTADAPTR